MRALRDAVLIKQPYFIQAQNAVLIARKSRERQMAGYRVIRRKNYLKQYLFPGLDLATTKTTEMAN